MAGFGSGAGSDLDDPARQWRRIGLAGAVLVFVGLAILTIFVTQPFRPPDESAHVDYAVRIALDGHLPSLADTIRHSFEHQRGIPQHTANHPPLFYLLISPLIGLGAGQPDGIWAVFAARAVSAVFGALTVVMVAAFAQRLGGGRRPDLVVGAAAVVASLPTFVPVSAFVHNDGLATAAAAAAFVGMAVLLHDGLRLAPYLGVLLASTVAVATRAQGVGTVALCMAGVVLAGAIGGTGRWSWRGAWRGLAGALLIGGVAVASVGWFYLRNIDLYGDAAGSAFVIERMELGGHSVSALAAVLNPTTPLTLFGVLPWWWFTGSEADYPSPFDVTVASLILIATAVGAAMLVAGRWRAGRSDPRSELLDPAVTTRLSARLITALFALAVAGSAAMAISHVVAGGNLQFRYMFPALPVTVLVAAAALLRLPEAVPGRLRDAVRDRLPDRLSGRLPVPMNGVPRGLPRGYWLLGVVVLQIGLTIRYVALLSRQRPSQAVDGGMFTMLSNGLERNGIAVPELVIVLLFVIIALGVGLTALALRRLSELPALPPLHGAGIAGAAVPLPARPLL